MLNMYSGASVTNSTATASSTTTSYGGGGIAIYEGATFHMYGGTISGNSSPSTMPGTGGGGVYNRGNFTMYGGTISGNSTGRNGGAVHLDGGTNTTASPTMTMTDGLITGNYSTSWAGGIEILAKAGLIITGGKINSNTCGSGGGGIELDASGYSGYLQVAGSAQITGNMRNTLQVQDNVYIDKNLVVSGNFTGSIGITHETAGNNAAGMTFGTNNGNYSGMENFFCSGKPLIGTLSGTNVIWKSSTTALTAVTLSTNSPVTGTAIAATLSPAGATATYQWYSNSSSSNSGGKIIVGASEGTYTPTSADVGKYLYVIANGTGGSTGMVTSAATTSAVQYIGIAATPVFSVDAGTYSSGQSVEISCATSGADIYYTTNGDTPTSGSAKYSGAIAVSSTTTIKAIAVKTDYANSGVASATYTITAAAYTATVNTHIDGAAADMTGNVEFRQNDAVAATAAGSDAGVYTAVLNDGTYDIYINGEDTGKDVVISGAVNSAAVDYYTVSFAVINAGTAAGSTISAVASGTSITSGTPVLSGKSVTITASGAGATTYAFAWMGSGASGQTTAALNISSLSGKVDVTCTITGTTTYTATVNTRIDGAAADVTGPVEFRQNGAAIAAATGSGTGVYTAQLYHGTYDIYINGEDTGKDFTINAGPAGSETIDYYTVNFAAGFAGDATGGAITATANGSAIPSGTPVLAGKHVMITASGSGTPCYAYTWSGGAGDGTTGILDIALLSGPVSVYCTIKGVTPRDYTPPVTQPVQVTAVTFTGATFTGSVISSGSGTIAERGFVYGPADSPSIGGAGVTKIPLGMGTGSFTTTLTTLEAGTAYYIRTYVITSSGITYGKVIRFTTGSYADIPKTGDGALPSAGWVLCGLGAAGLITLIAADKKRKATKHERETIA